MIFCARRENIKNNWRAPVEVAAILGLEIMIDTLSNASADDNLF